MPPKRSMLSGHDPGRKGSVAPPKAKVMIRVVRGMLANLRLISRHPTTGCPPIHWGEDVTSPFYPAPPKRVKAARERAIPGG